MQTRTKLYQEGINEHHKIIDVVNQAMFPLYYILF